MLRPTSRPRVSRAEGSAELLRGQAGRLRIGPWHGDHQTAYVSPFGGTSPCATQDVRRAVTILADRGYTSVVTAALAPIDQAAFLTLGFEVRERLHLLARETSIVPTPPREVGLELRRARRHDHRSVLTLDHQAFEPFWRLDQTGLADALGATPSARFRVLTRAGTSDLLGYSIVGRASHRGYIQRLAVAPACQGAGVGRVLLFDGLRWLDRRRVTRVMVNTQEANHAALALYERSGFERQPGGLAVLALSLGHTVAEPAP